MSALLWQHESSISESGYGATRIIASRHVRDPPTDKTESLGTPVRAWQRTIVLEGRVCVLVVEAQGTDPLPGERDIQRFLHSFKPA